MKFFPIISILFFGTLCSFGQAYPLPSGCVSWWPGQNSTNDNIGGNPLQPAIVQGGTSTGGITYTNGEVGNAFATFDTSSVLQAGLFQPSNSVPFNFGTGNFTFELWARWDKSDVTRGIFGDGQGISSSLYLATYNGNILFGSNLGTIVGGGFSPINGTYYHIALTRNGTLFTIYVNGSVIATSTGSDPVNFTNLVFGYSTPGAFVGGLDEITVYTNALTGTQIMGIYNAGSSGKSYTPPTPPANTFNNAFWMLVDP